MREERRVVTAMFADLVGSTALSERLDPEDAKVIVNDAVARTIAAVETFGGTVKDLAGDGVLSLFGAPTAHEDDAERAVRAALRVTEEISDYASLAVDARLKPVVVDIDAFCLQNLFERTVGLPQAGTIMLLDVGASLTTLNMLQNARGLSNTILVGEKHVRIGHFGQGGQGDGSIYNGDHPWVISRVAGTGNFLLALNPTVPFRSQFGSWHPGVCQFVMGDGSVRPLPVSIDGTTLRRLAQRNDGEVIGNF